MNLTKRGNHHLFGIGYLILIYAYSNLNALYSSNKYIQLFVDAEYRDFNI